jgi:hypothetical protein
MANCPLASFAARLESALCRLDHPLFADLASSPQVFDALARELFALQFQSIDAYQKLCLHLDRPPEKVRHWWDIPCVPTLAFKEFEMTSLPVLDRVTAFHSSGTTTTRAGRHFHSSRSLQLYQSTVSAWFKHHLWPDPSALRIVSLTPTAAQAPHSSLVCMLQTVMDTQPQTPAVSLGRVDEDQGGWTLDLGVLLSELESSCAHGQPLLLVGTAYAFVHLLDALDARRQRLALPVGSRVMETGGYKGRSRVLAKHELHRLLTLRLGVPDTHIVTEYGMTELSSQAYDRQVGGSGPRHFRFPPWCRIRVVSPETGQTVPPGESGLLQVFDLGNVYSVLAVQTEDLVVAAGNGFEYVGRAGVAEPRGCSLMQA